MRTFSEYAKKKDSFDKKLLDNYGKYKVFLVDGNAVRNSSKEAEEFGGSGNHCFYKFIPPNEIWVEDNVKPEEISILVASNLYQIRAVERGEDIKVAYKEGLKKEKDYRESQLLSKEEPWKVDKPPYDDVYIKKYGNVGELEVWLVDGEKVRNRYKTDFIEGGHGYVYKFVPNQEIWLEYGLHERELPYVLLHEFVERALMKYKDETYDKAHKAASKCEWKMRCSTPGSVIEGYSKKEALALTEKEAMKIAKDAH